MEQLCMQESVELMYCFHRFGSNLNVYVCATQDMALYLCWDSSTEESVEDTTVSQFFKAVDDDGDDEDFSDRGRSKHKRSRKHKSKKKSKKHNKKGKSKKHKKASTTSSSSSDSTPSSSSVSSSSSDQSSEVHVVVCLLFVASS